MFARVKKSGKYQYLQIVENSKIKGKVKQRVIATVGRMDQLHEKGRVETLVKSLSRYSEKALLVLFEGEGGETLGERGFSKDHRPDLKQMVVGVVINDEGRPISGSSPHRVEYQGSLAAQGERSLAHGQALHHMPE